MTEGIPEWPLDTNGNYAIPVPLLSPDHTLATRHSETLMESSRVRRRRMQLELQEFLKVSWNFTEEQFSTFVTFFEQTIDNGAISFLLKTFEDSPTKPGELAEIWWELAFVNDYQFTRSDGVVSVSATLEVLDKLIQDALPDIVFGYFHDEGPTDDNATVEGNPSACRENLSVLLNSLTAGNLYVLEIAPTSSGPWDHFIWFALQTTEERATLHKRVSMSNTFPGNPVPTVPWFRVKLYRDSAQLLIDAAITKAGQPLAAELDPPDLTVANVSEISNDTQLTAAASGSSDPTMGQGIKSLDSYRTSNGFVIPYSYIEDPLIFTSRMYRPFIRKYVMRQISWGHWGTLAAEGSQDTPATITAPLGTVGKWTRDGTVPTLATPAPIAYAGVANNAFVIEDQFKGILMARAFLGPCPSPLVMVCVDKLMYERPTLVSHGLGNSVVGSCDLPVTDPVTGMTIESGQSCNLVYGGICPFEAATFAFAISVAAPSNSRNSDTHGPELRARVKDIRPSTYIGWPTHWDASTYFEFVGSDWNSTSVNNGWTVAARNHNWAILCQNNNPLFLGVIRVDFQASLAGAVGSQGDVDRANWAAERDVLILQILANLTLPELVCNVSISYYLYADRFDIMRSPLYYDEPRDLHWLGVGLDLEIVITNIPFDPTLANPPVTPYDQFETYYEGNAITATMDFRTGVDWDAAWTIKNGAAGTYGWDFFETYADGVIPDHTTHLAGDGYVYYSAGEVWDGGVTDEWVFTTPEPGIDYYETFESYANGPAPFQMSGGYGWTTLDPQGWRCDNDLLYGVELFETYADGAFVGSNTGTFFVANENWIAT